MGLKHLYPDPPVVLGLIHKHFTTNTGSPLLPKIGKYLTIINLRYQPVAVARQPRGSLTTTNEMATIRYLSQVLLSLSSMHLPQKILIQFISIAQKRFSERLKRTRVSVYGRYDYEM